jgi:hypothetical protein
VRAPFGYSITSIRVPSGSDRKNMRTPAISTIGSGAASSSAHCPWAASRSGTLTEMFV